MVAKKETIRREATNATAYHDALSEGDTASPDDGWRANAHRDAAANASRDAAANATEDEEDAKAQRRRQGARDAAANATEDEEDAKAQRRRHGADDGWRANANAESPVSTAGSCADTAIVGTPMTPLAHMLGDKGVHELSSAELSDWMEKQGAKQETLDMIQYQGMTGEEFVYCFDPSVRSKDEMNETERALKMDGDTFLISRCRNKVRKECEQNERQRRIDDETKLQYDRNESEDRAQAQRIERQQIANEIAQAREADAKARQRKEDEDAKAQERQREVEHAERMYALKMKTERESTVDKDDEDDEGDEEDNEDAKARQRRYDEDAKAQGRRDDEDAKARQRRYDEDARAQERRREVKHAERMYALKMETERKSTVDNRDDRTEIGPQYDKITVRLPMAPKMKNVVDGITGDAWDKFETGTKTYTKFNMDEAGKIYAIAFDDPSGNIAEIIEYSSEQFKRMDMAIFTMINEKASENIMQFIGDIEECKAGEHYSGAMVCANVAKVVSHRSAGKRVRMAELISKQQPIVDAREVKERLIAFNKQLAECKKNGIQVGEEHLYLGLERMIEPLLTRPCLTMEMSSVMNAIGTRRGEYKPLKEALLAIANDLAELPGSKAVPGSHNPFQEAEAYSCCCIPQEHKDEISDGPGFNHE